MKTLQGTAMIKVMMANLKKDAEYIIGKIDPFCRIKINEEQIQTSEKVNAGKKPEWKETFNFYCRLGDNVKYSIFDQDPNIIGESILGDGEFPLTDYYVNKTGSFWFPLKLQGEDTGELGMEVTFFPDNESCQSTIEQLRMKLSNKMKEREMLKETVRRLECPEVEIKAQDAPVDEQPDITLDYLKLENERVRENLEKMKEKLHGYSNELNKLKGDTEQASKSSESQADNNKNLRTNLADLRKLDHQGKLCIDKLSLSIKESSDLVSEMDPYIIFHCGDEIKKTTIKRDGGCNTSWDERIELFHTGQDTINFFVFDQETLGKDELIANGCLAVYNPLVTKGRLHPKVLLHGMKHELAGTLYCDLEFIRS